MRRFILKDEPDASGRVLVQGRDFRYLSRVLRLKEGSSLRVLLPSGAEAVLRIREVRQKELCAFIERPQIESGSAATDCERKKQLPALLPIYLCQSLPKGKKMDLIVRQAAELGLQAVLPFTSEHSVSRKGETDSGSQRMQRWQTIIKEARQQSGSDTETRIYEPGTLNDIISFWNTLKQEKKSAVALLLHQNPLEKGTFHGYLNGNPEAVVLAVGPEGGYSDKEAAVFTANGFKPLLLGVNVLRTETAALAAAAAVTVILLEQKSWNPSKE